MGIRLRYDYRKAIIQTTFKEQVTHSHFAKYAREFSKIPKSEIPLIYFGDCASVTNVGFSLDQMVPHAEQMIARMAHGGDLAAVILLAPKNPARALAQGFRDIAADSFPVEVYADTDQALDRLQSLLSQVPKLRRVPVRDRV